MLDKKDMIIAVLAIACVAVTIFTVIPTRSASIQPYDPWVDVNDDGRISMDEINMALDAFGSTGTAINKTALLIDVNATYASLLSRIDSLNSAILAMDTTIAQLQSSNADLSNRVSTLEGNFSILLDSVNALEANYSVTNLKLAPYAIPFNVTYSTVHYYTTETADFIDMPYTSVMLTLNRTSELLIMFSADAGITSASADELTYILCQATVNGNSANPTYIELTPLVHVSLGNPYTHSHRIQESACSYDFIYGPVSAGTYTIKIRWYLSATGQGDVWSRTLTVIALPA